MPALKAARTAFIFEGVKVTAGGSTCRFPDNLFVPIRPEADLHPQLRELVKSQMLSPASNN